MNTNEMVDTKKIDRKTGKKISKATLCSWLQQTYGCNRQDRYVIKFYRID